MDIFAIANKKKFRFSSGKGDIQTEDLFDLPLTQLDNIAVNLDEQVTKAGRKSFIGRKSESATDYSLKLDVVKAVIEIKQAENEEKATRAAKAEKKAFLNNLLLKKQENALESLSVEEIQKQLAALE